MHSNLFGDVPKEKPEEDRLGYAHFAKNLANSICEIKTDECLVFAICGPWGTGKTSCLNFVRYYIQSSAITQEHIIVFFNPWWFSGRGELIKLFFKEFSVALKKALGKQREYEYIIKNIGGFLEAASEIPGAKIAAWLMKQASKEKSFSEVHNNIKEMLKKANKRFLIILDDIDRLTSEEIRNLFCVIKAVADFPFTIYLLAFDKDVVIESLNELQPSRGKQYLEKIVQVPFDLPTVERASLHNIFIEDINTIFADTPSELVNQSHWDAVFSEGIEPFLDTIRNIKRLTNALKVTYPQVIKEVNAVDFIAIETLRVFRSEVYNLIKNNPEMFVGHARIDAFLPPKIEDIDKFLKKWFDDSKFPEKEEKTIKTLLMTLFPKLEAVYKRTYHSSEEESFWRRHLRICSSDIFPIYFRLSLPEGQISNVEINSCLALAENKDAFANKLIELSKQRKPDGPSRLSNFLERMEDFTDEEIPIQYIPNILKAFFNIGDLLLIKEDELRGLFGGGNGVRIGRLVYQLIMRYDNQDERFTQLKEVIEGGEAVSIIVDKVELLGQQQGKYESPKRPEVDWIVNREQLIELEQVALQKIKDSAAKGELLKKSYVLQLINRWKDWESIEAVKEWISKIVSSHEGLVDFLCVFLSKSYVERQNKISWQFNLKSIEALINPADLLERCKEILKEPPTWLKDEKRIAVEKFIDSLETKR